MFSSGRLAWGQLLAALLLVFPAQVKAEGQGSADAGTKRADVDRREEAKVDPGRLEEIRKLVPLPLLYGTLRPEPGRWITFKVEDQDQSNIVRIAHVASPVRKGVLTHQFELDFLDTNPRSLVVHWIGLDPRPIVLQTAVWVPPGTPLATALNIRLDLPDLHGTAQPPVAARLATGPFKGEAQRQTWVISKDDRVEALTTGNAPLFGVHRIRRGKEAWTAIETGTGATTNLGAVPMTLPQLAE